MSGEDGLGFYIVVGAILAALIIACIVMILQHPNEHRGSQSAAPTTFERIEPR